jgi:membrane-bound lytic murein transglycosylase A
MIKIYSIKLILIVICLSLFLTGCTLFVRAPEEPGLKQLSDRKVYLHNWVDDLDFEGLEQAVAQSIRYYEKLPSYKSFNYAGSNYSPEEMTASLNLFMEIVKSYDGGERVRQLQEKFLFYESRNQEGEAFFTGYYEPVLEGSVIPTEEFTSPLYETPDDLISADLGQFPLELKNETIVGRLVGRQLLPYDSRDDIVYDNSLAERARTIVYVNEIELFFLQIQGSGLINLQDGGMKRVNYAQKNGHPYRSIGKILQDEIPPEEMSLQSIKEYLYANPDEVREIFSYNQSYTFFREIEEGPLGNIEVPLTPKRSIAMDRRIVPGGGLAYIETEVPVFENDQIMHWDKVKRFALVQDTGGAIRDHGRVDIFFGNGEEAEYMAGHLKNSGRVFLLVARKEYLK